MTERVKEFFKIHFVPDWPIIPKSMKGEREVGKTRTINIFLGFFFMVNFILGTGFLGIPYGFFHGGLIAGTLTLAVTGIMAWLTALYELESMARAQALTDFRESLKSETNGEVGNSKDDAQTVPNFRISLSRKFEVSEMSQVFVGRWLKIVYLLILTIHSFLACLSYSTVTGSAWSVNLPLNFSTLEECSDKDFFHQLLPGGGCLNAYRFSLFLFAVVVIPLSLLDLKDQAVVQFLLGVLRFVTLGGIILYCFVYMVQGYFIYSCKDPVPVLYSNNSHTIDWNNTLISMKEIALHFDFKGWIIAIPVFVYALTLHQGIPSLTHPIKQKQWLRGLFNVLFVSVVSIYGVLGLMVSLWFRNCTNETCTLNWAPLTNPEHHTALRVLSYYIILFPSIDICSVFPLVIHTMVNNLYTVFNKDTSQVSGWKHCLIQIGMKFIAAVIPISVAMFISNLVYILKYAGLLGFFVIFFMPIVFQLSSQWVSYKTFSHTVTEETETKKLDSLKMEQFNKRADDEGEDNTMPSSETNEDQSAMLLDDSQTKKSAKRFCKFLFMPDNDRLYTTPYSLQVLSHPLFVVFVLLLAVLWFILTFVSLFFHPTSSKY